MKNINTGKEICSFLKKKLSLFNRYLSITKRMKQTLNDKEAGNLGGLASQRQDCINKIERIDLSMEKIVKAGSAKFKGLIDGYLKDIKSIIETIGNFSISSGNFENSILLLLMSFPRRRESSAFAIFLDSRFHGNDVWRLFTKTSLLARQ